MEVILMLNNKVDKETRQIFINEMVRTRGWEIFVEEVLERRKRAVRRLMDGDPSNIDMNDVVANRARVKVINEMLSSVIDNYKEEK
jgi:hypothetical protein